MSPAHYLVDTSALGRLFALGIGRFPDWSKAIQNGLVAVSPVTELELLYSARSAGHRTRMVEVLNRLFLPSHFDDRHVARAWEIQRELTARGEHRSAGPVDLMTAATAELNQLVLLHYDWDFDTITRVTEQQSQWFAAPVSL
ncbi:hypothetical protein CLV63_101164 [Murinocardiopsis flavida]|uniref:Ribonuclease VapC n=1 Tax=Murinocardiopsis flavida TaxID=645275 RepID=A0A2P8DTZ1_9ACTN|nr:PIN domain nuclease [Murinocardiopsis flavida]PSL00690.1 hypothetical protein CLV63_101164 [Murinocardiopsis flavida]